jgi:hypothetical protein
MNPIVNTSVKSFSALKGSPASSARYTPKYYDEEPPKPSAGAMKKGLFRESDDITSPLKQIGMNPQYMISLPCVEVDDLANKKIHQGKGRSFDRQLLKATPFTGMDKIAFEKDMRVGEIGMDKLQRAFTFGSFQYC